MRVYISIRKAGNKKFSYLVQNKGKAWMLININSVHCKKVYIMLCGDLGDTTEEGPYWHNKC